MITINFIEVGRNNLSWSDQFKTLNHDSIVKSIKRRGALMSGDIELDFETATIYVGGFRSVGKFTASGLPMNHEFYNSPAHVKEEMPI